MNQEDRNRATSFGDDASQYDRARPGYPAELFDDLVPHDGCDAVDVGCGTGFVAQRLAERGCTVVGVEPDPRMAEVARAKGIEIAVSTFEDWDSAGRAFDLLTSGQAWHWVHPERASAKAALVLRSGARFGLFWNNLRHRPEVADGFDRIYSRFAPHLLFESVALGTSDTAWTRDAAALERTGAFVDVEPRSYTWERTYSTTTWLDELPTHSGHRTLPREQLDAILNEVGRFLDGLGGEFVVDYVTTGLFGRRV